MDYFDYNDFKNIDEKALKLAEGEGGESELTPIKSGGSSFYRKILPTLAELLGEEDNCDGMRRSDLIAVSCIREYEDKGLREPEFTLLQKGTVHVVPHLVWEEGEMSLEVTMGESRQYVVRNLEDFCICMELESTLTFGKYFSIRCTGDTFHKDSQELIRFIMKRYIEAKELERLGRVYSNAVSEKLFSRGKRGMNLTPSSLDEAFALYQDQSVSVCRKQAVQFRGYGATQNTVEGNNFGKGFDRKLYFKDGRPILPVEVSEEGAGVRLQMKFNPLTAKGKHYLYVCFQTSPDYLWRCDGDYMRGMDQFMISLRQTGGQMFISKADMARFCACVLPEISEFVEFTGAVECFARFAPASMQPKVYLDSPARDVVAAVAKGDYDGIQINLYNDEAEAGREEGENGKKLPAVLRNELEEQRLRMRLERWFTEMDAKTGVLYMKGNDDQLCDFVKNGQHELAKGAQIFITDRYRRMVFPTKTKVAVGVSLDSQLLKVTFDFEGFPVEELLDALASYRARRRYHRLSDGAFLSFEEAELQDAFALVEALHLTKEELARGAVEMPRYRAMYLDSIVKKADTITFDRDSRFRQLIREIHGVEDSELEPPARLNPILRDYQKTGFRWLATMTRLGFGGILADDMGLGKTLEVISLLVSESEKGVAEKQAVGKEGESNRLLALVVCPASLVLNWEQELIRFAPELTPWTILGTAGERRNQIAALQEALTESGGAEKASGLVVGSCVAITSYDLLKRDLPLYENVPFSFHIVDEAQYIKNYGTQNAKAVKGIDSIHRFALTGTPVENRLSELWSIFDFLMPGYLGRYKDFREDYEAPVLRDGDEQKAQQMKGQIMPFVLRRLKRKVLKELPEKVESVVYVPMEPEQRKIYLSNLAKVKLEIGKEIREGSFESSKIQILAMLTKLRQICCHPALCYENYTKESGKLEACVELVKEAVEGGRRVLLFSQFTSMLSLLASRLSREEIEYYTLTGQTAAKERLELAENFNRGGTPVFLISLKAGGTGLNLTGADVVIHYDPWWNQAAQNQATDRAHRIGQKNSVQVYKLVASNTIEEKIVKLQESKRLLADSVIEENSALLNVLDENQLRELFL